MRASVVTLSLAVLSAGSSSAQVPDFDRGAAAASVLGAIRSEQPPVPALKPVAQDVQQYRLERYPKGAGPCVDIARRLAADFSRVTGKRTLGAACEKEDEAGYTIAVSYEGTEPLEPVTTAGRVEPEHGFGAFESRAACEAALPAEAAAFRQATGLEPVAAYCQEDTLASRDAWSMRLDSFGEPRLRPDTREALVFTYPQGFTKTAFLGRIQDALKAQGVDARWVVWRGDAGYARLGVSYYARERLTLTMAEPAKVDTQAQCEAMYADLDRLVSARKPAPLASYCGTTMVGGWELAWLTAGKPSLKTVEASDEFGSYDACLAGREAVAKRYRESLGHAVAGALCSRDVLDGGWKAVLLED